MNSIECHYIDGNYIAAKQRDARVSVVVCVKNEAKRITDCLESLRAEGVDEIIVVDGDSTDGTRDLSVEGCTRLVHTKNSNMVRDRQIGIDACHYEYILMIDADHRLGSGTVDSFIKDLERSSFDIVQGQMKAYRSGAFWTDAEEELWDLTHNVEGPIQVVEGAPTIYYKEVFDKIRYDDTITSLAEDTDFSYRLKKYTNLRMGVGKTLVWQEHEPGFSDFIRKYKWYGKADAQFIKKHPGQSLSHLYHLLIRYPVTYALQAVVRGKWKGACLMIIQGLVRSQTCIKSLVCVR